MDRRCCHRLSVAVLILMGWIVVGFPVAEGQEATRTNTVRTVTPTVPPTPARTQTKSPSALFRELLSASSEAREAWLASRPEATRTLVTAKLKEFADLPPTERELRLQVAELEFFLTPLLRVPESDRARYLERIPPGERPLIDLRLRVWDGLAPDLRRELLESQKSLSYFIRSERADSQRLSDTLQAVSQPARPEVEAQFSRWAAMDPAERQRRTKIFQRFFDLTPLEKERTVRRLSEMDRLQASRVLEQLAALDPAQRERCMGSFRQFAAMSPAERAEFMSNASRWREMKPEEQSAWRSLVENLDAARRAGPPSPADSRPGRITAASNH